MTSILINSFREREERSESIKQHAMDGCAFCAIIQGELPAFKVYEDERTIAFLGQYCGFIGQVHHERMTSLPDDFSAHMGGLLPRLCRAICKATDQQDFNIVNNNGYAQVVPHVHWHIVPAPLLNSRNTQVQESNLPIGLQEIQRREELDDGQAEVLARTIVHALDNDIKSRL